MWIDPMLTGQRYRVPLQLIDAEQLRAQQLSIPAVTKCSPFVCRKSELFDGYDILLAPTRGLSAQYRLYNLYLPKTHTTFFETISQLPVAHNYLMLF
jgi:hypothetical protein